MDLIAWLIGGGVASALVIVIITVIVVMAIYSVGIFAPKEGIFIPPKISSNNIDRASGVWVNNG